MINKLRRSLSKTYLSVAAAVVFSTSLSNNATAVTYSETAQRLQTMSYSELREEYLRVGDASFNNSEFPFKVPGPLPLGEEAVGAASPSFTIANRLMRNLSYPFIYNTSWRGKNFYKTDEAIATGACNVDRANSSFTITNKLGFLLRPFLLGTNGPAEIFQTNSVMDNKPTWDVTYTRMSPQAWYLRDELRMVNYDENIDQGTWFGFMWLRPIPGFNRFSTITAVWIIDQIGAAPCLKDEYLG